ncbi:MAG: argininosuccinate lyase [Candidatus Hadarchaeota archaeon]
MLRRGRFGGGKDPLAEEYTSSMKADPRIFHQVVQVNMAHVMMLAERGIIPAKDASAILKALLELHGKKMHELELKPELEDIHMVVEKFVSDAAGEEAGGRMHTAKSRNDQVSTAIRMALRMELVEVEEQALGLVKVLMQLADKNINTIMPGYTHTQIAQPTTFAHWLAAHAFAFLRDAGRLERAYESANSCPLGACAFAGTSFPTDRVRVSNMLGFRRAMENTMDSVGSRDFTLEAMGALAIAATNLSRLAAELILWSTPEFNLISMPDEFSATSSIMPQKKNAEVAEIARAKAGAAMGNLAAGLALMKALPHAYNLDFQELTPLLWSSVDGVKETFAVMAKLMEKVAPNKEIMRRRAEEGFSTATELADLLVKGAGLPFRSAHAVVGKLVADAIEAGKGIGDIGVEELKAASKEVLEKEIKLEPSELKAALDPAECVRARTLPGGPAPKAMQAQVGEIRSQLKYLEKTISARRKALQKVETKLLKEARGKAK